MSLDEESLLSEEEEEEEFDLMECVIHQAGWASNI